MHSAARITARISQRRSYVVRIETPRIEQRSFRLEHCSTNAVRLSSTMFAMAARDPRRRPRRERMRRERHLSRDAIIEAAIKVLDAEGADAVTMRRIAGELNTGAASLYAHVEDK